jgi:tRNA threonylcarbamoyladenosine biosynthesis protein TsaE
MKISMDQSRLNAIAKDLLREAGNEKVFAFFGEMGMGKTTLIKALCKEIGATTTATSPTFSIVNEYNTTEGTPIYHFDCYRIEQAAEAFDIGLDDYFYSGHYCFIEWPDKILDFLPETFLKLELFFENGKRKLHLKH